jgi:hypothetical protein
VIVATLRYVHALVRERLTAQDRAGAALPLPFNGGDRKSEERRNQGSVTTLKGDRGADYLTTRIARDRPDILERMKAGAYKSVRAGALVQRRTTDASYPYLFPSRQRSRLCWDTEARCFPGRVAAWETSR